MYNIEKKDYGYKLTFKGIISEEEMLEWVCEVESTLYRKREIFGVLVDMRNLHPLSIDAIIQMRVGQKLFKINGMARSTIILPNSESLKQFTTISQKICNYEWERYIITILSKEWERVGSELTINYDNPNK